MWSKIVQEQDDQLARGEVKEIEELSEDYTVLFLGDKSSGKTTIVNKYLEKSEQIVPSTAMEYSYGKRSKKSTNLVRDVVHTWELSKLFFKNTFH